MRFFKYSRPVSISFLIMFVTGLAVVCHAQADEAVADPSPDPQQMLADHRERLAAIDQAMQAAEDAQEELRGEARDLHMSRHQLRTETLGEDEELTELRAQIEQKQRELHDLQTELTRRVSENPEYVDIQARQMGAMEQHRQHNTEIRRLSEERVQVQLAIQRLERELQPQDEEPASDEETAFNPALEVPPDL